MKKIIIVLSLFVTTFTFAQSNNPGTIQLGVNWGVLIGGVNTELNPKTSLVKKENNGGAGVGVNYAFRAQFGIIKQFSAGLLCVK